MAWDVALEQLIVQAHARLSEDVITAANARALVSAATQHYTGGRHQISPDSVLRDALKVELRGLLYPF